MTQRRRKPPSPEEVVAALVALADDAVRRAVALGLVIERRGRDGASHLAVSGEGWNLHRAG